MDTKRALLILSLVLATASFVPAWATSDGGCVAFQGVAPGGTTAISFSASIPGKADPEKRLALLNYFPSPFFKQKADVGEQGNSPLLDHYQHTINVLLRAPRTKMRFLTNEALLIEALTEQRKWVWSNRNNLYVPPLRTFIKRGSVAKLEALYEKTAAELATEKPVPYCVPTANEYYILKKHPSPLKEAPQEILAVVTRVHREGLLTSPDFNKFVAEVFTDPFQPPEQAIADLIHRFRSRLVTTTQSVNAVKADLLSGNLSETDLAAYLAFYYPELVQQALIVNRAHYNDDFHEWINKGLFTSQDIRGRLGYDQPNVMAHRLGLADLEAKGWNMRDPQRETALALAYLSGEKKLPIFDQPVLLNRSTLPTLAHEAQQPLLTLKESTPISAPAPITAAFVSPPKPPMEALAPIHFATADSHSLLTDIDSLAMAHLDISASLREARQQFKVSEENNERPALARVVALLQKKNPEPGEISPALAEVKNLLALNAAKLKHLSELKSHSAELVELINNGVENYEAAAKEFPAIEGASSTVVSKVNAGLEALSALRSTAKNSESVDRSISQLEAEIAEERKTIQKIALVLGNPLSFQETREPLAVDLEALGHNGH